MKLKRIKKLKVNSFEFRVNWTKKHDGGSVSYKKELITIGTLDGQETAIFMIVCHELWELCAIEMGVRLSREDCDDDFMFVYDHRQHTTMIDMFSGLLAQFIE